MVEIFVSRINDTESWITWLNPYTLEEEGEVIFTDELEGWLEELDNRFGDCEVALAEVA